MADYKKIDLQIGTEEQFEEKKLSLPVGTLVGITDPIHESELDTDLQTKINEVSNKLTAPTTPTADSAVVLGTDGTVNTKPLSEFSGKLFLHNITLYLDNGSIYFKLISDKSDSYTIDELITIINPYFPAICDGSIGSGAVCVSNISSTTVTVNGAVNYGGALGLFNNNELTFSSINDAYEEL